MCKKNPVLGFIAKGARDPSVIWDKKSSHWIMTLHLGDQRHTFKFFKSKNLLNWEPLEQEEIEIPGGREFPEFFLLSVNDDPNQMDFI